MLYKILAPILFIICTLNLKAQEGCFGFSITSGIVEHGAYLDYDDGALIRGHKNKYIWPWGVNNSGKLTLSGIYYYKDNRFETNVSFYPSFSIYEPLPFLPSRGTFSLSNLNKINPYSISFLAYKNWNKKQDRVSLNPGIGLSYYNLSTYELIGQTPKAFFAPGMDILTYEKLETIHNKSNYQIITALELAFRIGTYTYISFKGQYHFGLFKMYERSYTYRYSQSQELDHTASLLYYGNHYNFSLGVRWRFNALDQYHYIE